MKTLIPLLLILCSCAEPHFKIPCKYNVGDRVKLVTNEVYTVTHCYEGDRTEHEVIRNPSYKLTAGFGWRIGITKDGFHGQRGTYFVYEIMIKEVVPQ